MIGQERAKRAVAIAAYNHQKRLALKSPGGRSLVKKSNILLIGPTGSGKTHIARNLANILAYGTSTTAPVFDITAALTEELPKFEAFAAAAAAKAI